MYTILPGVPILQHMNYVFDFCLHFLKVYLVHLPRCYILNDYSCCSSIHTCMYLCTVYETKESDRKWFHLFEGCNEKMALLSLVEVQKFA